MKKIIFLSLFILIWGVSCTNSSLPSGTKTTFVEAAEGKLFCRIMGKAGKGTALIVLHGGPGLSQDYLLPHLSKLAKNHFVIFYDQSGCGRSERKKDAKDIDLNVFIDDLEVIRHHFGLEKISVLGHSFGGFIAMQYAIAHPEVIDQLVLLNSMPSSSRDFAQFTEEYARRVTPFMEELELIQASKAFQEGDSKTLARYLRIIFQTYSAVPETVDQLNLYALPQANKNFIKISEVFSQTLFSKFFDLGSHLKNLSCKTLIIHGDKDPIPVSTARTLHKNIKNSKFAVIKDCGHFPFVEKPEELFQILDEFLE